ncbi:MAG: zinc ribbon domain-containing protein [Christensenellales bacterium]
MKFDSILQYQEVDKKLTLIEQEFFKNEICVSFIGMQNKLKQAAAKLDKVTSAAADIAKNEKSYVERIENIKSELSELEKVIDGIEDINEAEHYVKMITNLAKELESLEKELAKDKTKANEINKEWADTMKAGQECTKSIKAVKQQYDELFAKTKADREVVEKELKKIEKDIPAELLDHYKALKKAKKMPAFVEYVPGSKMCTGCRMEISQDVASKLKNPGDMAECSDCGRILFIKD